MKALLTGAMPLTNEQCDALRAMGLTLTFQQSERDRVKAPEQYGIVLCSSLFLYNPIADFTALRLVQLASAGYDRVDLDYAAAHGIKVFNAGGVYSVPMAEFAIGGILELYKQSPFMLENQRAHLWKKHRGLLELTGKRICIVGTGEVGREIAHRLKAFGCILVGVNRTLREEADFASILPLEKLPEACAQSDIVILSIALTNETRALVRSAVPQCMKEGAVLVNVARGGLVDTNALAEALKSGRLFGAALDVFEEEPLPPSSPLWDLPNVVLTPHNSFVGEGNNGRMWKTVYHNLKGALQ